jgi:hypothetical protein
MDKKTHKIIIIGSIITFIIVPIAATLILSNIYQKDSDKTITQLIDRTDKELLAAITSSRPELISGTSPTITIVSAKKPETGWYVVTIRQNDDIEGMNPATVVLQDDGKRLNVLLGPGTEFPSEITSPLGIPINVLKELNK